MPATVGVQIAVTSLVAVGVTVVVIAGLRLNGAPGMTESIGMVSGPTQNRHPNGIRLMRGLEISAEAADSARSTVLDQVTNGVSVRMAALYLLLAGERDTDTATNEKEDAR